MSDNPLADWLREGGPWSPDEPDAHDPPTALGPAPPDRQAPDAGPPASVWPEVRQDEARTWPGARQDEAGSVPEAATAAFDDWDDDPAPRPPRARRLLLLGLAVVPWLGFAAVALATFGGTDATPQGHPAEEADAAVADPVEGADEAGAGAEGADGAGVVPADGAGAAEAGDGPAGRADAERRAAAAASVAVHTALTGEVTGGSGTVRYVDHAMVESLEWVGDVAVVGVSAVVLESAGETWGEPRPARFAVPVRVTEAGAVPAADPWPLPASAEGEAPAWEPVHDEDLATAAARALTDAGYDEVAEVTPHRSDAVPGVVAVDVIAAGPGSTRTTAHHVWLRDAEPPALLPPEPSAPLPPEPSAPLPPEPSAPLPAEPSP